MQSATAAPSPAASTSAGPTEAAPTPGDGPLPTAASTKPVVPLDKPEQVDRGLTARVSRLEAVKGEAQGPGEVAGPAVRASVTLTNRSGRPLDLSSTVVNLYYGNDNTPASALSGPGVRPLPATVKARDDAIGRFVFAVPPEERSVVLITVDYSVQTPVVAFRGRAPR